MVFGWGKKREPRQAPAADVQERRIPIGDVDRILYELEEVRTRTMIAEARSLRGRISPGMEELGRIGAQLEGDDLNMDDVDRHLGAIVKRGKRQVISIISEETASGLPEIRTAEDVASLDGRINRMLRRVGDVLGRQSRVIHLFAKKYAGKLKNILAEIKEAREEMGQLVENHKRLQEGIAEIKENTDRIGISGRSLEKMSARVGHFEGELGRLEGQAGSIRHEIDDIKGSKEYVEFLRLQEQYGQMASEGDALRREINDQFTKVSRPLGKYEYVTSLDRQQRDLLRVLVDDPYGALSPANKTDIIVILQAVKKGVLSGSVSVKDAEKSVQFLDEATETLASLISKKADHASRRDGLKAKMDSLDTGALGAKQAELEKTLADLGDAALKRDQLRAEISDTRRLIPRLVADVERTLRGISSIRYIVETENS